MPKLLYMICSESGADDANTHLPSFFNVIDRLGLIKADQPYPIRLRVTASWVWEESDSIGNDFESLLVMFKPLSGEKVEMGGIQHFTFTREQYSIRIAATITGGLPIDGPGILRIQSCVRHKGQSEWTIGELPIQVVNQPSAG